MSENSIKLRRVVSPFNTGSGTDLNSSSPQKITQDTSKSVNDVKQPGDVQADSSDNSNTIHSDPVSSSFSISHQKPNSISFATSNSFVYNCSVHESTSMSLPLSYTNSFSKSHYGFRDQAEQNSYFRMIKNEPPCIPLTPYTNQVGGHASFLRFSDRILCKPMVQSEKQFYEMADSVFPDLKEFMAAYLGLVNVTFKTSMKADALSRITDLIKGDVSVNDESIVSDEYSCSFDCGNNDGDEAYLMESTPIVLFENNSHLLKDLDSGPLLDENSKMKTLLKDALSPSSLRTRMIHLKNTMGAMRRNSSAKTRKDFLDKLDFEKLQLTEPQCNNETKISKKSDENLSVYQAHKTPSEEKNRLELDNSIFHMSEDELDTNLLSYSHSKSPPETPSPPQRIAATTAIDKGSGDNDPSSSSSLPINPWSLHLYASQHNQTKTSPVSTKTHAPSVTHQFMLLEDLTVGMKTPCVLDLKMGTRQYGVNSSLQKRLSQEKKCEKSTSKQLGVRICGMQTFNVATKSYIYLDKYKGRKINVSNFKETIMSFLDNGEYYLVGYIPAILRKLEKLYQVINKLGTCRFYACSLLILYDAIWFDTRQELHAYSDEEKQVEIKMIDFAHSLCNSDKLRAIQAFNTEDNNPDTVYVTHPPTTKGPDLGYLKGLESLIQCFSMIYEELGSPPGHVKKNKVN